jgi:hypothetical protein
MMGRRLSTAYRHAIGASSDSQSTFRHCGACTLQAAHNPTRLQLLRGLGEPTPPAGRIAMHSALHKVLAQHLIDSVVSGWQ